MKLLIYQTPVADLFTLYRSFIITSIDSSGHAIFWITFDGGNPIHQGPEIFT